MNMLHQRSDFLTPAQLAKKFGIGEHALAVWRMKGTGPAYIKMGGVIRYRVSDVEDWLEKKRVAIV